MGDRKDMKGITFEEPYNEDEENKRETVLRTRQSGHSVASETSRTSSFRNRSIFTSRRTTFSSGYGMKVNTEKASK